MINLFGFPPRLDRRRDAEIKRLKAELAGERQNCKAANELWKREQAKVAKLCVKVEQLQAERDDWKAKAFAALAEAERRLKTENETLGKIIKKGKPWCSIA
jgi:hypothetical protein